MEDSFSQQETHKVYHSLVREPLFLGLKKMHLLMVVLFSAAMANLVGFNLMGLSILLFSFFLVYPLAKWATSKDPDLIECFARSLWNKSFYMPLPPAKRDGGGSPPSSVTTYGGGFFG